MNFISFRKNKIKNRFFYCTFKLKMSPNLITSKIKFSIKFYYLSWFFSKNRVLTPKCPYFPKTSKVALILEILCRRIVQRRRYFHNRFCCDWYHSLPINNVLPPTRQNTRWPKSHNPLLLLSLPHNTLPLEKSKRIQNHNPHPLLCS